MPEAASRRTKIVATIGPASEERAVLRALVGAGMDGARLNFSHGTHEEHARRYAVVRDVQEEVARPLAIIADLQGPKLRIGNLVEPVLLQRGDEVELVGGEHAQDGALPVSPAVIGEAMEVPLATHDPPPEASITILTPGAATSTLCLPQSEKNANWSF